MTEYIAYQGNKFAIEWYFDENDNSQALEFFNNMEDKRQDKTLYLFIKNG
jgi:hypothetical protein